MGAALSKEHRHLEEEKVLLLLYPLHSLYGMNFRIENKCLAKRKKLSAHWDFQQSYSSITDLMC